MASSTVRLGGARIDISGQDADFQRTMKRAGMAFKRQEKQLKRAREQARKYNAIMGKLKGTIAAIAGGLGFAAITNSIREATAASTDYGSGLVEVSQRIGTTVEDLQVLRRTFEGDGIAAQKFDQIMSALVRRFSADSPTLQRAIERVGITRDEWLATEGDVARLLPLLARGFENATNQADRLNLAQEAFSSSGRAAAVILQKGPAYLAENAKAMAALGLVTKEEAQALKDWGQELANIRNKELTATAKAIVEHKDELLKASEAWSILKVKMLEYFASLADKLTFKTGDLDQDKLKEQYNLAFQRADALRREWETLFNAGLGGTQRATDVAVLLNKANMEVNRLANLMNSAKNNTKAVGEAAEESEKKVLSMVEAIRKANAAGGRSNYFSRDQFGRDAAHLTGQYTGGYLPPQVSQRASVSDADKERAQEAAREIEAAGKEAERVWMGAYENMARAGANAFASMITGAQSFKDAMRNVATAVIDQLVQILIVQRLVNAAMGVLGGGWGSAGQGQWGTVAGGVHTPNPAGFGGFRASGGPVMAGRTYRVNEGPEYFTPNKSGQITNGMPGGRNVTINIANLVGSIQSTDGPGVQAAIQQAVPQISESVHGAVLESLSQPGESRQFALGY